MLIKNAIDKVINYCDGHDFITGNMLTSDTTRDRVLYGDVNQECTGIVTCIWPTVEVVKKAQDSGANFIITHEAIFWNHGDRQDVVAGNLAFEEKRRLLDAWGGAVWRCHDYIHSGVPIDRGQFVDGIFYGLAWKLGWLDYRIGNRAAGLDFLIPEISAGDLARYLVKTLGLRGTRLIGDANAPVKRVHIPMHILGESVHDTEEIHYADKERIDCMLAMEFIDFTTCEYVRDAAMLGLGKSAIVIGHFNLEEPGMEYMAHWVADILSDDSLLVRFIPMEDTYNYIIAENK